MGKEMGLLTTAFADIQCSDLYLEQVDLAVVYIERADHRHHIVNSAKSEVLALNNSCATGTFDNGDDISRGGCIDHILQDIPGLYESGRPVGEGGSENRLRKKVRMEDFMIKNLFHGGSGGFDGDGAIHGYRNRGNIQTEHDRFIGRPSIGNEIVPAKHANVITGSIPVVVLRIGWTLVDAGGIGFKGEVGV